MVITPVQGQANLLPPPPASPQKVGPVPSASTAAASTPLKEGAGAAQAPPHERAREIDRHARPSSASGLEVRLHVLADEGATILQFVDPRTKQVMREFPAADLVRVLAAIRGGTGRQLDQTA